MLRSSWKSSSRRGKRGSVIEKVYTRQHPGYVMRSTTSTMKMTIGDDDDDDDDRMRKRRSRTRKSERGREEEGGGDVEQGPGSTGEARRRGR